MLCIALVVCVDQIVSAASGAGRKTGIQESESRSSPKAVEQGRKVYAANCGRCHGLDGRGKTEIGELVYAPDLTRTGLHKGTSDGRIKTSIRVGRGAMPAFGKKLSRQEIDAVARYVRSLMKEAQR